jgi:hypothetical protein
MMERDYYKILCLLAEREYYLIWYSEDQDGLLTDEQGLVLGFPSLEALDAHARDHNISIHEGMTTVNLDVIADWAKHPNETQIDCSGFLDAWNLFSDIAASVDESGQALTELDNYFEIYDKLFRGNNLPAFTNAGEEYIPHWTKGDIQEMVKVFNAGLELFQRNVQPM